ncbi:protein CFAP276-like [Sycon ciliatum]|uniref:protein CFAP276-like n=1 Tax=Sycon ciliatum TaxID=27933 RepID=UPI0020A9CDA2|eukprot:scpid87720/ scgid15694/ Uncharacterized protein C1orf194 homolog
MDERAEQSKRAPYPYPTLENDSNFGNTMDESFQGVYHQKSTEHIASNPWERLNSTVTLSSVRRSAGYYEPDVPSDQLDFAMKGQYDHHGDGFKGKNEVLYQKETLGLPHRHVLKNRIKEEKPIDPAKRPPVVHTEKKKANEHSSKGAISGHHTTETNQGYSRKRDGGFFTC